MIMSGTVYIIFSRISPTNTYQPRRTHYVKTDIVMYFRALGRLFFRSGGVFLQAYTALNQVLNAGFFRAV